MIEPNIAPIRSRALKDEIVERVEDEILTGTFRAGARLVERDLARRFGVSPIPVREALQELEMRGLVIKQHNRGCSVIELSPEQVERACAVRTALEPKVIGWAARNLRAEDVPKIKRPMREMARAVDRNDIPQFFRQDMLLHKALWEASRNEFAARALESIVGSLFASSLLRAQEEKNMDLPPEVKRHARLVDAVLARDAAKAEALATDVADRFEAANIRAGGVPDTNVAPSGKRSARKRTSRR